VKRLLTLAFVASVLAGCQTAQVEPERSSPVPLSSYQIVAIQEGVKAALKDPESARFGEIRAGRRPNGDVIVCGWVNAKNGFGGYTGMEPFNGMLADPSSDRFAFASAGGGRYGSEAVMEVCKMFGVPL
jgi:hypothetical protein